MNKTNIDVALIFRKKSSAPPSVLVINLPNQFIDNQCKQLQNQQDKQRRSLLKQRKKQIINFNDKLSDCDYHSIKSRQTWQRYSEKIHQINPAPDILYRKTYFDQYENESFQLNHSRSTSPNSFKSIQTKSKSSFNSSTIYDQIRQTIRHIEKQRNMKQQNLSLKIKRPLNEDSILRRLLPERKSTISQMISTTFNNSTIDQSNNQRENHFIINQNLRSAQSFVNYINYSRLIKTN